MFGAGLPVCAVAFGCLDELVHHEKNGLVFTTSTQLATQLEFLLEGFPNQPSGKRLDTLREGVRAFQKIRWHDNWVEHAWPLINSG